MYGVIFAGLAIAIRLVAHYTDFQMDTRLVIMLHLFLILLAIFFESAAQVKKAGYDFIDLFKAGMRGGLIYALVAAVFVYIYYAHIAPEIFETRNAALTNSPSANLKPEDKETMLEMFTASKYAQFSFFGYFLMSVFYSLLVAVIQRKLLRKAR